jgi:hypothetical protein
MKMADKRRMIIERLWIMKKAAQEINELTTECYNAPESCKSCVMDDLKSDYINCSQIEDVAWIEIPEV